MAKTKKPDEEKICGKPVSEIRAAYYDGKIEPLCAAILANGAVSQDDIKYLGHYLETLKNEEKEFREKLKAEVTGPLFRADEAKPPSLDELIPEVTEEQAKQEVADAETRAWAVNQAKEIIRHYAKKALTERAAPIDKVKMMNDATAMGGLMLWLSEDKRLKEREYKKRLIVIIDDYEVSRREAEDRADVSPEFVAFKLAADLYDICDTFILNAKKQYGGQYQ